MPANQGVQPPTGPHPNPPPRPPQRGGGTAAVVAVLVLALAVAIGMVSARIGTPEPTTPPAQSDSTLRITDAQRVSDMNAAAQQVAPAVVTVDTELGLRGSGGAGTGIVLSDDGDVLTNNHVVEGATRVQVTSVADGATYRAAVAGYDRRNDVAVLRLADAAGLPTASFADSAGVRTGDEVIGVGNAGGTGTPTAAAGRVTALDRTITASDESTGSSEQLTGLIEVAADIRPGDSGGPLVNASGRVIGVNTAASQGFRIGTGGGQGYALPIDTVLPIASRIRTGAASDTVHIGPTAYLGLTVSTTHGGALVRNIVRGGPADRLGLVTGSVITELDGDAIGSSDTLIAAMDSHHPGDTVRLTWIDASGESRADKVELTAGPVG